MRQEEKPHLPLSYKIKSIIQGSGPTVRAGIFPSKGKDVMPFLSVFLRWKSSMIGMLGSGAKRNPERLAIVDDFGELTYAEAFDNALALARAMQKRGMDEHTSFGLVARNGRGSIFPQCVKTVLGSELLLMNINSSTEQIDALLSRAGSTFLFVDDEFLDKAPVRDDVTIVVTSITNPETREKAPVGTLFMDDLIAEGRHLPDELPWSPKQGKVIIMSSGTTGIPKGVLRIDPIIPTSGGAFYSRIPYRRELVIHQSASMFHAWGWACVILAFATGSTLVTSRVFTPETTVQQCQKYGANAMISAAFFLRQLEDYLESNPDQKIGDFEFIVSSGNTLPVWLANALTERFGNVIGNFYGSTEIGCVALATGSDIAERPDSVGKPAMGVRVEILDDNGNEVPAGETGHIFAVNELTFTGYMSRDDKFTVRKGMVDIGDLGYFDEDGYLHVLGRGDDMVIKGGENIFPRELEDRIDAIPGIAEAYCYGSNDADPLMAELTLCLVREDSHEGNEITEDWVKDYARKLLGNNLVPDHVYFMKDLPRNAVGKVVPRFVKQQIQSGNILS